jgi:hypothetical protein
VTEDEREELRESAKRAHDEGMRRLVEADQYETVMPRGVAKRVPRDVCRCPILDVGDFCPVHGG